MKTLSTVKQLYPAILGLAAVLCALPARADISYADQPLFNASGTKPNVALMVDNSGSMGATDTGGTGTVISTCNGTTSFTQPLTRMDAAEQAACQVVTDNANNMRIGLFAFTRDTAINVDAGSTQYDSGSAMGVESTGVRLQNFGAAANNIKNSIFNLTSNQNTPLSGSMRVIARDFLATTSPLQYRCQKNYVVFFTDGEPSSGIDYAVDQTIAGLGTAGTNNFLLPSIVGGGAQQTSPWPGANSQTGSLRGSPNWDGYPDPIYPGGAGRSVYPFLDDLAQLLYDVDLKTDASTSGAVCPDGSTPAVGKDCAGKSWNGADDANPDKYKIQNVTTFTVGLGAEANNGLLRNTPLTNRIAIGPADVDVAADTIRVPGHGLSTGAFVQLYNVKTSNNYSINVRTTAVNTTSDLITGDTTNMRTGDVLTYSNAGGTSIQHRPITTPPTYPTACGDIGGLSSGNDYFVRYDNTSRFWLYNSAADANNDNNRINLLNAGAQGTSHTFNRAQVAISFTAGSAVNTGNNIRKITYPNHGFKTGDRVTYTRTTTSIGGLTNGSTYYVAVRSANEFRLSTTFNNAHTCDNYADGNTNVSSSGTCIALTSQGSGTQTFTVASASVTFIAGTPSSTSPVDEANNRIDLSSVTPNTHSFITADKVNYTCTGTAGTAPTYSGTNSSIPTTVYAIVVTSGNPGTFRIAQSSSYVPDYPMDLAGTGNNNQTFSWTASQAFIGGLYAYETDAKADATPYPRGEATARGKYYVDRVDADTIKLRECGPADDCTQPASSTVDITSTGYGYLSTGPGKSYFASTTAELASALKSAFSEINGAQQSFTSLAANSGTVSTSARVYQATYSTQDWSGDVRALKFVGQGLDTINPAWLASVKLASQAPTFASRNVKTIGAGGTAIDFTTGNVGLLTAAQRQSLSGNGATPEASVLRWIRGESIAGLRTRTSNVLGDIVNSSLEFVGQPAENFGTDLPVDAPGCTGTACTGQTTYNDFKALVRPHVVYAGGNDGMLHAFNADLDPFTEGSEMLGFIPRGVYTDWVDLDNDGIQDVGEASMYKFHELAQPYYGVVLSQPHRYFVNGPIGIGDAYFATAKAGLAAGNWHSVLVGGLGKGGRSVYALDITNGNNFANNNTFLWEFTDGNSGKMGYTYSKAVIARLGTGSGGSTEGQWVAIFGNGYDSAGDEARLFIVNLETGAKLYEIHLDDPASIGNNGLSSVSLLRDDKDIDADGDKVEALAVYAGDLQGNVWKVPLNGAGVPGFTIPATISVPFFVAAEAPGDGTGRRQRITTQIILQQYDELDALDGGAKEGGLMLFFGTGSYFRSEDQNYNYSSLDPNTGPKYNSMYGIWDKGDVNSVAITQLQEQKTTLEAVDVDGDGDLESIVKSTANQPDYSDAFSPQRGWFRKLAFPDQNIYQGESLVFAPTPFATYLIYNTVIPAVADPCESGGGGARYRVDALTGGASTYSPYDFDGDGDNEDEDASITGVIDNDVIYTESKVFEDPTDPDHFIDCAGGNDQSASCQLLKKQKKPPVAAANIKSGRMTWRQLQ